MFGGFFDIVFFAAFAAFIAYRLYTVLGREDFNDDSPKKNGRVVPFPGGDIEEKGAPVVDVNFTEVKDDYKELKNEYGKKIADNIKQIRQYDPNFSVTEFIGGAKAAFEMIIKAFSKGDGSALRTLLGKDAYKGFMAAIEERKKKDIVEETTIVAILSANIKDVILNKKIAKIAVHFVSEQINLVKDKQGKVIEGDPSQVDNIEEIWTFERNLASSNPNWELVQTSGA